MDELENAIAIPREEVLLVSAKEGTGVPALLQAIVDRIPPPKGDPAAALQALVFDSHYDQYKGVVVYIRLAAGTLHDHDRVRLMASGAEGTQEQFTAVLEYLSKNFGPAVPIRVNQASAAELVSGLGLTDKEAAAVVKYRTDKGTFKTVEDLKKVPDLDFKKIEAQKDRLVF